MPNQHTAAREAAAAAAPPAPELDAPDLGPEPDAEPGTVTVSLDELQAMIASAVAEATAPIKQQARGAVAAAARTRGTPSNPHQAPAEPTYLPAYIPTEADVQEFAAAIKAGVPADEPIAREATIIVVGPDGSETECTPKVFRVLLAGRGYKAHPDDAQRHLNSERRGRPRRGGGNIVGSTEQAVAEGRRRRRHTAVD